jgi:parvulin-like peptidyl-prolyl isomerase
MMRTRLWQVLVGTVVLVTGGVAAGDRIVLESMLVRVNDRIVTVTDFRERLLVELSQIPSPPSGTELESFARQIFDAVVDELVLLERAQEKRITVEDEMVDSAIDSLREENELQDDAQFEAALRSAGLSEQMLRDRYHQSILLQRVVQTEIQPTEITEEELRQFYQTNLEKYRVPEKVELEQLFFPLESDGSDRTQALRTVEGLLGRVRQGNDLAAEATLAGVELQDLGAIPLDDLRSDLQAVLDGLAEGQLTEPLETGGGLQVIRLVRRLPEGYQPFEEVEEVIRREISLGVYESQTKGMVERLKEGYLVEIHEDRLQNVIDGLMGA